MLNVAKSHLRIKRLRYHYAVTVLIEGIYQESLEKKESYDHKPTSPNK